MEGPTPVSALIHAATMVTAGVFLIVRCSPLFEYAPIVSLIITISGAMTAFMAATIGLVQNDLKRVIAYSTCSQLGYMMIACGTSGYNVSMFHLTNHAFFKALLFLSAGSVIHALRDEQDMRKMGGILNLLPFTYSMILIGSLSLMGFPFLTGFYSKDLILEWTFSQYSINSFFAYWLGSISAFFTAFYSLRVISLTFLKKPSTPKNTLLNIHEAPLKMAFPLLFLSVFSIFIGYILKDMFVGLGTSFWGNSIFILPKNALILEAEFLNTSIKLFPVFLSLSGGILSYLGYNFYFEYLYKFKISLIGRNLYNFLNRKWFFDKVYNYILSHNVLTFGYNQAYQNIDRGILEFFGPTGISYFIENQSQIYLNFYNKKVLFIKKMPVLYFPSFILLLTIFFFINYIFYNFNYNLFNQNSKDIYQLISTFDQLNLSKTETFEFLSFQNLNLVVKGLSPLDIKFMESLSKYSVAEMEFLLKNTDNMVLLPRLIDLLLQLYGTFLNMNPTVTFDIWLFGVFPYKSFDLSEEKLNYLDFLLDIFYNEELVDQYHDNAFYREYWYHDFARKYYAGTISQEELNEIIISDPNCKPELLVRPILTKFIEDDKPFDLSLDFLMEQYLDNNNDEFSQET